MENQRAKKMPIQNGIRFQSKSEKSRKHVSQVEEIDKNQIADEAPITIAIPSTKALKKKSKKKKQSIEHNIHIFLIHIIYDIRSLRRSVWCMNLYAFFFFRHHLFSFYSQILRTPFEGVLRSILSFWFFSFFQYFGVGVASAVARYFYHNFWACYRCLWNLSIHFKWYISWNSLFVSCFHTCAQTYTNVNCLRNRKRILPPDTKIPFFDLKPMLYWKEFNEKKHILASTCDFIQFFYQFYWIVAMVKILKHNWKFQFKTVW